MERRSFKGVDKTKPETFTEESNALIQIFGQKADKKKSIVGVPLDAPMAEKVLDEILSKYPDFADDVDKTKGVRKVSKIKDVRLTK